MRNGPDDGTTFLRARREAAGYTVKSLAHVAGISPAHLCNIEAGRRRPSPDVARTLTYHLGVPLAELEPPERAAAA